MKAGSLCRAWLRGGGVGVAFGSGAGSARSSFGPRRTGLNEEDEVDAAPAPRLSSSGENITPPRRGVDIDTWPSRLEELKCARATKTSHLTSSISQRINESVDSAIGYALL